MGTPLGDFIRAKRDGTQPATLGVPDSGRRRSPGLRRMDLAGRAGISVEYLTRIEQGRDRNPSVSVLNAVADALSLSAEERNHLRYLAKISGGECIGHTGERRARREPRPGVLETLHLLEPAVAAVMNRLGDVFAHTTAFEAVLGGTGLLDGREPNLTRYLFTDPRSRELFPDWEDVADEQVFNLWRAPSIEDSEWFSAALAPLAGPDFTARKNQHKVPQHAGLRLSHPTGFELRFQRESLELPSDGQQIVVFLPADEATAAAVERLRGGPADTRRHLRAVS